MKKISLVLSIALCIFFEIVSQSNAQDNWTGNIDFHFGTQTYTNEQWEWAPYVDVGKQKLIGCNLDFGKQSWPVNIDIGYFQTNKSISFSDQYYSGKNKVSKNIFNFGFKKNWEVFTNFHPYLAGELEYIISEQKSLGVPVIPYNTITDKGLGLGFRGGLYWIFANHINLGIELGYSWGIRESFLSMAGSENLDGNITEMSLLIGYHW